MEKEAELTFEQAIARLEEIVRELDGGGRTLNETLLLFEEGIRLARQCSSQLAEARGRLDVLTKRPDGSVGTEPHEV
ncbi:MAG TPA: exodeoxyribonuclease VII small subunit [Armatimonadota bacterium]|nr:exodeoxyribonuclease VII small subunit [Armatimonadota bacterium]